MLAKGLRAAFSGGGNLCDKVAWLRASLTPPAVVRVQVQIEDGLGRALADEDGDEQDPYGVLLPQRKVPASDAEDPPSGSDNEAEEKMAKKGCSSSERSSL